MRYIALLRSINVGKHNRVTMAALKSSLSNLGLPNVESYLQSGNLLFEWAPDRVRELDDLFAAAFLDLALTSHAIVRSSSQLTNLVDSDPFDRFDCGDQHKFVAFFKASLVEPFPATSKKGDIEIAYQSELDACYVSHPIGGIHGMLATPKGTLATVRNWTVTRSLAGLLR